MADTQLPLTDKQVERLTTFLLERTDYSLLQLMGFFTAIISSPRSIAFNEWLERLDITKSFSSQKESEELITSLSKVFSTVQAELKEKKYKPVGLTLIQESNKSADEMTDLFLDWIDGFLLGMDLVGQDWVKQDHKESAIVMGAIIQVAKYLYDDETRMVSNADIETVQANVKTFHDYWVKHRTCEGKPQCVIAKVDMPKPEIT